MLYINSIIEDFYFCFLSNFSVIFFNNEWNFKSETIDFCLQNKKQNFGKKTNNLTNATRLTRPFTNHTTQSTQKIKQTTNKTFVTDQKFTMTDDLDAQKRREECERKARRGEMDPRLEFVFQLLMDGTQLPRHQIMDHIFEGDMVGVFAICTVVCVCCVCGHITEKFGKRVEKQHAKVCHTHLLVHNYVLFLRDLRSCNRMIC